MPSPLLHVNGGCTMNEYIKLEVILETLRTARSTIGTLDRPPNHYGYEDFETPALRDLYYELNAMCIKVAALRDATAEATTEEGEG